jgi:ribonuclease HI
LAKIAEEGFSFTTFPHRLIVYTDGSSLSNGKSTARAGLGVYWGDIGLAGESNIAERVPGVLQTNNRGELLVRPSPARLNPRW